MNSRARPFAKHKFFSGSKLHAASTAAFLALLVALAAPGVPVFAAPVGTKEKDKGQRTKDEGQRTSARLFDGASLSLRVLPNGVRGVVRPTRNTGLVAVQVWVRAGSRHESSREAGASRLVESVALSSSRNFGRSTGGARESIEALGGQVVSQTARDATSYGATVATPFFERALKALSDAVLRPDFSEGEVGAARDAVNIELLQRAANPVSAASDLAFAAAFSKHPYARPASGTVQSVQSLSAARLRAYHAARYTGGNISVVVVGDVQPQTAHALIARYFAGARVGAVGIENTAPVVEPAAAARKTVTVSRRGRGSRSVVALAFRAPGIEQERDVVAMDVLLAHWSEGRDAALRRVLLGQSRDEQSEPERGEPGGQSDNRSESSGDGGKNGGDGGAAPGESNRGSQSAPGAAPLAEGFDVGFLTQRDPGLFIVSLVVEPQSRARAVSAALREVARVRRAGITPRDLARAKRELKRQYIEQSETVSGQAGALGFYEMIDTYQFAATYLDRIDRITMADIKRTAQRYLADAAPVQAVIEAAPRPRVRPRPPRNDGGITA